MPAIPPVPTKLTPPASRPAVASRATVATAAATAVAMSTGNAVVASAGATRGQVGSRPSPVALEPHWAATIDAATD